MLARNISESFHFQKAGRANAITLSTRDISEGRIAGVFHEFLTPPTSTSVPDNTRVLQPGPVIHERSDTRTRADESPTATLGSTSQSLLDRVSLGSDEDQRLLVTLYSSLVLNLYI